MILRDRQTMVRGRNRRSEGNHFYHIGKFIELSYMIKNSSSGFRGC